MGAVYLIWDRGLVGKSLSLGVRCTERVHTRRGLGVGRLAEARLGTRNGVTDVGTVCRSPE